MKRIKVWIVLLGGVLLAACGEHAADGTDVNYILKDEEEYFAQADIPVESELKQEGKFISESWDNVEFVDLEREGYFDINQITDYEMPIYFGECDLKTYSENLFQTITCYPDLIKRCSNKLTSDSIDLFVQMKWPDESLFLMLDWAETSWEEVCLGDYVKGKTIIGMHYENEKLNQGKQWEIEYIWKLEDEVQSCFEIEKIECREREEVSLISLKEKIPEMTNKELSAFTAKLFLTLAREPSKIVEYAAVFGEESVKTWENIAWYYAEPERVYDNAGSACDLYEKGDSQKGYTFVSTHYCSGEMDFENVQVCETVENNPYFQEYIDGLWPKEDREKYPMFDWEYDSITGKLHLDEIELLPNLR